MGLHRDVDEQRQILVVEDDEATRAFLLEPRGGWISRAGATSAGEGVRAIEVRRPSLVVLDLALESGTGLDVLDRVRHADCVASRIDPDLPMIVLSGRVAEADRVRSFARGADDHVCKPTCDLFSRAVEALSGCAAGERLSTRSTMREIAPFVEEQEYLLHFCSSSLSKGAVCQWVGVVAVRVLVWAGGGERRSCLYRPRRCGD